MNKTSTSDNINFTCRVSSILNKDVKSFGKNFMFDNRDETCWNSDKGEQQWIAISFEKPREISSLEVQFQGGFAAEHCILQIRDIQSNIATESIKFENNNSLQKIFLQNSYFSADIKLLFDKMFDTYGRIIIYHLKFK